MKKWLTNLWVVGGVALLLNVGLTTWFLLGEVERIAADLKPEEKAVHEDDLWQYWSFHSVELQKAIAEIKRGHEKLDTREAELQELEERVTQERSELARLREDVAREREALSRLITKVSEDEAKNLKTLAKTYSELEPTAAIRVFDELDDTFVVKLLSLMKSDTVSNLFDAMIQGGNENAQRITRVARLSEMLRLRQQEIEPTQAL
jgi:flagellar motility protein MotE (MotC chaperone)